MQYLFGTFLFILSLFLIMLVLVQRGRGGGLAGAFGGMGGQSAFGTKAGDLFTRVTIVVAAVWILTSVAAIKLLNQSSSVFGEARSAFPDSPPGVPASRGAAGAAGAAPSTTEAGEAGVIPAEAPASTPGSQPAASQPASSQPAASQPSSGSPAATPPATAPSSNPPDESKK
jgi:preprotein translocase subunit SecG